MYCCIVIGEPFSCKILSELRSGIIEKLKEGDNVNSVPRQSSVTYIIIFHEWNIGKVKEKLGIMIRIDCPRYLQ